MSPTVFLQGFGLSAGLIIAIGAQNAFVLRQGLKRRHVFATAFICALCDLTLIVLGVAGFGTLIAESDLLTQIATWGGAAFLFYYGFRSFRSALQPGTLNVETVSQRPTRLRETVLATLAISLLNPHVYLDTVVLLGSIGASYPADQRLWFALGAAATSMTWFFGLAYGAMWLTPLFQRPLAWRILDVLVGCVMWAIAISLLRGTF